MKNIALMATFASTILLSIPFGKMISKIIHSGYLNENESKDFDKSLRNYHPNKGE